MNIEILSVFAALVLTVSLATERLVLALRSVPGLGWLNSSKGSSNQENGRSLIIQVMAFLVAWVTSGFLEQGGQFNMFGTVMIGGVETGTKLTIPVFLLAILSLGGSTLWKNILGYTKAVRDTKREIQKKIVNADDTLENLLKAQSGLSPAPAAPRSSGKAGKAGKEAAGKT